MGIGQRAPSAHKEGIVPGPSGSALGDPWEARNYCADMVVKIDHYICRLIKVCIKNARCEAELTLEEKTAVGCSSPGRYHHKATGPLGSRGMTKRGFHGPTTDRSCGHRIAPSGTRFES
jgi:hypothetical protein